MIAVFSGLLIPIALMALVVIGIRKVRLGDAYGGIDGNSVRRFFQYVLSYGLIVVSALGLTGLLGRMLERSPLIVVDKTDLARNLSFVVVGIPLYLVLAFWTRRRFREDASEAKSFGWSFYLTLTCTTSLVVAMFALRDMISWAARVDDFRAPSLARLIVWGGVWGVHWWAYIRSAQAGSPRVHFFLGSTIALGTVAVGFDQLISGAIQSIWSFEGETLFISHGDPVIRGFVTLMVGVPVWYLYWIRNYSKTTRDRLWLTYVLLVGVGGGLIASIVSASTVLYRALVWLVGDPGLSNISIHFRNLPTATGAVFIGVIIWWYHHGVLGEGRNATRTEVQRVYEYLMSGVGLFAASGGFAMVVVALVEAFTSTSIISGSGATNALLAAATLLFVGTPVWWIFWRRIQTAILRFPDAEHSSPTRRIYLFILFGLGGVIAVATLLIGVFFLFDDLFKGNFGMETIRRMKFALALLLTTGATAGYHWLIYRSERELVDVGHGGPGLVLMVGPNNLALVNAVSQFTGGRVQNWIRKDDESIQWNEGEVLDAVQGSKDEAILLIAQSKGLQIIPIERG